MGRNDTIECHYCTTIIMKLRMKIEMQDTLEMLDECKLIKNYLITLFA